MSIGFKIVFNIIFSQGFCMNVGDAFHQTVHGAAGGCEALAVRLGMSAAILRNKANPNASGNKPTLDDADRVMSITGDHGVLHALAAGHGFVCVRVEDKGTASDMAVLEIMTKCWTTNGDFGAEVNRALADGRIERHEIDAIRAAVMCADRSMHQLVARLEAMAEVSPGPAGRS